MSEITVKQHFGFYHRDCCELLRLSVLRICSEEPALFLNHTMKASFFARMASFTPWFHYMFFCQYSPYGSVSVRIPQEQMKLQLPLHLRIFCAFREFSKQGRCTVCKELPYILPHLGLPLYSVRPPGPSRSCKSCLFFVRCRAPGGKQSTVLFPF